MYILSLSLHCVHCISSSSPPPTGVDSVFTKIGCDATVITALLGGHAGVTDITILQYLGVVEQRTNELLQLQAFIQAKVRSGGTL